MAELRAVRIFLEEADRLGIETPLDYSTARAHMDVIQAALNNEEGDYDEPFPTEVLVPSFALAQHYGVPTRLLDWTESALVAAYFAALPHSSVSDSDAPDSDTFSIVGLERYRLNNEPDLRVVAAPRYMNANLRAQKGLFTFLPRANAFFVEHGRWPAFSDLVPKNPALAHALCSFERPVGEADHLLRGLLHLEISRHQLFPSLGNAATSYSYKRKLFAKSGAPAVRVGTGKKTEKNSAAERSNGA